MKTRILVGTTVLGLAAIGSTALATSASALPNCGGQSAAPQPVPYTCALPGIDITAFGVTRHFSAVVYANGATVSATFTMTLNGVPAPLTVDVPIRIVHHEGVSGGSGGSNESQGVIPAGSTTGTVSDSAPCRDGQLDVKAVFIGNGESKGRVGGPWIQNGTGCTTTTTVATTVATTIAPTSSTNPFPGGSTSAPGTTEASPTSSVVPTSALSRVTGTLPPTGGHTNAVPVALMLLLVGSGTLFVVWITRKRSVP